MRNIWRDKNDPQRCDNVLAAAAVARQVDVVVRQPVTANPLTLLARRKATSFLDEILSRNAYLEKETDVPRHECVDMCRVQDLWQSFLSAIRRLCSPDFWQVFLAMHTCSGVQLDAVLEAVKKQFVTTKEQKKFFPSSRRLLMAKIAQLPDFWVNVLHTTRIDLTKFKLPSGTTSLEFKFVNPVWAWLMAARRQDPRELHWRPVAQARAPLYGGGIQFGEFFKTACRGVPAGSSIMAIALHWDGTSAHRVSSSPICIGVGNSNTSDSSAHFCIAYMPHVPDETNRSWRDTEKATTVKHYIKQRCARAILIASIRRSRNKGCQMQVTEPREQ